MRLLVCGSRTYSDAQTLTNVLDALHLARTVEVLIEGGATGADRMARTWAEHWGIPVRTFNADWDQYGKAAGAIRNKEMLEVGKPDVVLAFVDKELAKSKGTANMVGQATKAGVAADVVYAEDVLA